MPKRRTIKVKRGSAVVKIRPVRNGGYAQWVVDYWLDGQRRQVKRSDLTEAREHAESVATRISNGDAAILSLTKEDAASLARARELLSPIGKPIEVAAAEYAEAAKLLGSVPLIDAARFYVKRNPANLQLRQVAEVVDEMIAAKRADGLSEVYVKDLELRLGRFAEAFQKQIADVRGHDVDDWLRKLEVGARSRINYRRTLQTLFEYSKSRRYVPSDFNELDAVAEPREEATEIEIFTPEEIVKLLAAAPPALVPSLAIGAFAGLRSAETERLDWSEVRFGIGFIEVKASKSKTASRRLVPISENLRLWLLTFAKPFGRVWKAGHAYFYEAQRTAARRAGVAWKHNALRHSFISYRLAQIQNANQVALEAGNSPQMIFRHYRELVTPEEARQWFGVVPPVKGETIPMPGVAV